MPPNFTAGASEDTLSKGPCSFNEFSRLRSSSLSTQSTTTASRLSSERSVVPSSLGLVIAPVALLSAVLDAVRLSTGSIVVPAERALLVTNVGS